MHHIHIVDIYLCWGAFRLLIMEGKSHKMGGAHPHMNIYVKNYVRCLRKMGMNKVQLKQKLEVRRRAHFD